MGLVSRPTAEERARWLARSPVFAGLEPGERLALARDGVHRHVAAGARVMRRGEAADFVLLVRTGRLEVCRETAEGERIVLRSLGPGAVLGLTTAAGAPATAEVLAAEPTEALLLPGRSLRALFGRRPEVALRALAHLADLLGRLTDQLEEERSLSLDERLLATLRREGEGLRELRLTHGELASRVGATRPNVSRALARLEAEGHLRRGRSRIALLDPARVRGELPRPGR